jgi:hypothetical protein
MAERSLIVSPLVVAVSYLLEREAGDHVVAGFLRSLRDGEFILANLIASNLDRMADLVSGTPILRWVLLMPPWSLRASGWEPTRSPNWTEGTSVLCGLDTPRP